MVYEGIGHMVGCVDNSQIQGQLIVNMLALPDQQFRNELNKFNFNQEQIFVIDSIKTIDQVIKINQRVAESVGGNYLLYLRDIFDDLLKIYNIYSQQISKFIGMN